MMYKTTCSSERYRPTHIFVSIRTLLSLGITFTITSRYSGIPTTATRVLMWSGLNTISSSTGSEGQLVLWSCSGAE